MIVDLRVTSIGIAAHGMSRTRCIRACGNFADPRETFARHAVCFLPRQVAKTPVRLIDDGVIHVSIHCVIQLNGACGCGGRFQIVRRIRPGTGRVERRTATDHDVRITNHEEAVRGNALSAERCRRQHRTIGGVVGAQHKIGRERATRPVDFHEFICVAGIAELVDLVVLRTGIRVLVTEFVEIEIASGASARGLFDQEANEADVARAGAIAVNRAISVCEGGLRRRQSIDVPARSIRQVPAQRAPARGVHRVLR